MCDQCVKDTEALVEKARERHGSGTKEFFEALDDCYEELEQHLGDVEEGEDE